MTHRSAAQTLQEGLGHHRAGHLEEAAGCYAKVRTLAPTLWDGFHLGGLALLGLGRSKDALGLFEQARELKPESVETLIVLAALKVSLHEFKAALALLREAVRLAPDNFLAWDKLGMALREHQAFEEALACHAEAVRLKPESPVAWSSYGTTYERVGRLQDALRCYETAVQHAPEDETALTGLAVCLYKVGRIRQAVTVQEHLLLKNPRAWGIRSQSLLALNFDESQTPAQVFEAHRAFGRLVASSSGETPSAPRVVTGPLRVGFLSPDLWDHPVGRFIEPLLERAEHGTHAVYLYSDTGHDDAQSRRLAALAVKWTSVHGLSDASLARLMSEDGLDVLVDLAGHSQGNRLRLLASRQASVQITYLGYPNTTGLSSMDYRLVDPVTDPEGLADPYHTERLLRFAPTAWCFRPPDLSPAPGRRGECVTFGCFNQVSKIGDGVLATWGRLLVQVPESRLLLKGYGLDIASVARPLLDRLEGLGLSPSRVLLRGLTKTMQEHLAMYNEVDVALDTSPYNGTTTTCEALWMGVPVVTLAGDRHVSRVGASLLQAAGVGEWVASSWDDYITIAAGLAGDRSAGPRGDKLRARLQASVLMDEAAQAARFWAAVTRCHAEKTGATQQRDP